nr:hypothetical protein BaRGS_020084 [Batillaria attramentaria]
MPSSALKKSKKAQRKRGLTVRFVDMGGEDTKNPLAASTPTLDTPDRSHSDDSISEASNCSSDMHEHRDLSEVDEEERECLRHLDELGHVLETTFKDVDSIDAYVGRLRSDFDHDRVPEHRYMTHICSAKIARTACCKRQLEAWRELQHGMQDLLCHFCHHHNRSGLEGEHDRQGSHEDEVNEVLEHLRRMSTFDHIVQRLNPGGDQRSFVEQWVVNGSA